MQKTGWLFFLFAVAFAAATAALIVTRSPALFGAVALFTGALIILVVLPKVAEFSIGPKGVEARISQLQTEVNVAKENIAQQQEAINSLVKYNMSASIYRHLCGIVLLKKYMLTLDSANKRELYFLRDHGFIQRRGGGFVDFVDGTENVAEMAEPTPIGRGCLRMRQEIPPEMLSDTANIREGILEKLFHGQPPKPPHGQ